MTVETRQLPITDIVADGATYAVPGEYHRSADIRVWLSTDDGDTWTLQAPGSDYSLEPSGPSYAGGTITPVAAWPAGASLRIDRDTLREQEFGAPPTAKGYEHSLDRVVMAVQDLASAVARSIRVPDYEAVLNALPRPAARALRFLTFDAAGQPGVSAFTVDDIAALVAAAPGDAYSSETRRYPTLALAKAAIAAGVLATGMQGRVLAYDATNQGGGFDFTVVPGVTAESHPEEPRIRIDDDMLEFQMFGSKTGASGPDQRATMQACIDYAARRAEYRRATPGHPKEAIGRIFWRGHFAIDSQLLGRSDVWIAGLQDDLAVSGLTARGDGRPNGAFHSANAIAMGSCWAYTSNQGFEESLIYLPSTRTAAFDRHSDTLTGVDAAALGLAVGDWIYGEIDERFKRNDGTGSNYSRFGFVYRITAIDQAAQTVTLHEPTFDGTATGATIYRIPRTEAESPLVCTKPNCAKVFAAINARLENIRIVQAVSEEGTVKSGLQADFQGQGLHLSMIDGKVRGVTVEGFKDACAGNPLAWCEIENCCFVAGYKAFEAAYGSFASKIVNIVCMVVDIVENAEGDYGLARYCFLICSEGGCFCTAHNVRCYYRSAYDGGVDRDDGEGGTIRIIPPVAAMYGQGNKWTGPDSIVKGNNVKAVALALLDDAHISGVEYGGTTHTGILVRDGRHRILQTKNDGTDYLRSALYCKSPTALITADVGDGSHYSHAVGLTDLNWFYNGTVVVGGISGKRPQNRLARNDNSAAVVPGAEKVLATYTFSDTEVDALSAITGLAVVQVAGANEGGTRRFFVRYNGARSQYAYILPKATGGTRTYQVQFNLSGLNRTNTNLAISIDRETDRQGTLGQLFSSPLAGTNTLEIVLENLLSTDPDAVEEAQGNISFQWSRFDLTNPGVVFAGTIPSFPEIDDDLDAA